MSGPFLSPSLADRPHRPATRHRLGEPLPHQRPDGPHAPPSAHCCFPHASMSVRGISTPFGALFPTNGQVRTCSSAVRHCSPKGAVRLTCVRHAASVDPEPGSNSSTNGEALLAVTLHCAPAPCGGERDARGTRQLVRCGRQKSERQLRREKPARLACHQDFKGSAPKRETVVTDNAYYTMLSPRSQADSAFAD